MSDKKAQKEKKKELNESKICPVCHLSFNNRKKWRIRNIWNEIKYCSDKCRKNKNAITLTHDKK